MDYLHPDFHFKQILHFIISGGIELATCEEILLWFSDGFGTFQVATVRVSIPGLFKTILRLRANTPNLNPIEKL